LNGSIKRGICPRLPSLFQVFQYDERRGVSVEKNLGKNGLTVCSVSCQEVGKMESRNCLWLGLFANNAAEAYFDPRADFGIVLVSRLVATMKLLAFGEGRVKDA
jgi:hypothetical protein